MDFINSKTFLNLKDAFMRESAAFLEYEFYSVQAKNDGFRKVSNVFKKTAENERAHAEIWFKLYHSIFDTKENLNNSAKLERFEWNDLYSNYSKTAKEEGFFDIAQLFDHVAKIEQDHEKTFKSLKTSIENGKIFSGTDKSAWVCLNCGHIYHGKTPPKTCPVCSHPQGFFTQQN